MEIYEYLELLKKKWYLLVIFPVVFGIVAAVYCWGFLTDNYTATANIYVLTKSDNSTNSSSTTTASTIATSTSQQLANDIAVLIDTDTVADAAAADLGLDSLSGFSVSVSSETTNRVISINVTGKTPDGAAKVADALAAQTAEVAVDIMDLQAVNILDEAKVPTGPSGPNRPMYLCVAILAGLLVAIMLIILLDALDVTVKSGEEAEEEFGYPVLGRIPDMRKGA